MSIRSLASRRNRDPFLSLSGDFDQLFRGFLNGSRLEALERESFAPRTNVTEDEKILTVTVELPGVDEKDVELTLEDGVLTIQGEKKSEFRDEKESFYCSERVYGSFRRSLSLPADVDGDKARASYEKGVLTVTLPKSAKSRKKTIPFKKA